MRESMEGDADGEQENLHSPGTQGKVWSEPSNVWVYPKGMENVA